jgi:hypothetical protein
MLPLVIAIGFSLGLLIRWWAVLVGALAWALVIGMFGDSSAWAGAFALGAVNAFVGAVPAILIRRRAAHRRIVLDGRPYRPPMHGGRC